MDIWKQHIHPHGPIRQIADDLWMVTGTLPRGPLPRNMVIHRLASGGLLLHSVIALDEAGMKDLEALGRIEVMIVPNGLHRLDAGAYKRRYPNLRVLAPEASRAAVEEVVPVDAAVEAAAHTHGIQAIPIAGIKPVELCYALNCGGKKALLFTDALMNLPNLKGFGGLLMRLLGSTGFFGMTRIGRWYLLKDRTAFKDWLFRQADGTSVVLVGHGEAVTENAPEKLRQAAARL